MDKRRLGRETDVSNTAKLTKDIILMMELFSCHRQKEIENVYKGKRLTVLERERERERERCRQSQRSCECMP